MKNLAFGVAAVVVVAGGAFVALKSKIDRYVDPGAAEVAAAGYVEKTAQVNQVSMSYVEGPDNGPPLVLLHAQHMDWFSYNRVLPQLSRSFHVFDIDYPGHGQTTVPASYPMTAGQIGGDLGDFIATIIKQPAYVTGNSSGGLLTAWLAANRPEVVRSVLLEDPPLFSAEYPRIKDTIAYRSFVTSAAAAREHVDDFLLYWIDSNSAFFDKHVFRGAAFALTEAVKSYRSANPGKPVEIGLLHDDTVRQFVRGLDEYDPRFGAAFYDGTFNDGFDHAETLKRIACPVLLLQANFETLPNGVFNGAMSQPEADRAMSLLPNAEYVKIDATHVVHLDQPQQFIDILERFFSDASR